MNTIARSTCSVLLIALPILFAACSLEKRSLEYVVDPSMIESVKVVRIPNGYAAIFGLEEAYRREFAKLTEENIGRELTIHSGGKVIVSTKVQAAINSGFFSAGPFPTLQEAETIIREVMPGIGEIPGSDFAQLDPLEFELQSDMLQSAMIIETIRGYEAQFRFAEPHRSEFARFTRENIGRVLTMRFKGRTIRSANIQGEIDSGRFSAGPLPTREEAEALIREVMPGIREIPAR